MTALKTRPTTRRQIRAEVLMHCPACGKQGGVKFAQGFEGLDTFQCLAYVYNPATHNECRFVFAVATDNLRRFR